jgi:hypothetical protein
MTTIISTPLAQLRKQHAQAMEELAKLAPLLVKRVRLLEIAIRAAEEGTESTYSKVRNPLDAIVLCLELHEGWMTKEQITEELIAGGYPLDAKTGRLIVGDAVKHNGKPGKRLARDADGDYVGLPEWVGNKKIKKLL